MCVCVCVCVYECVFVYDEVSVLCIFFFLLSSQRDQHFCLSNYCVTQSDNANYITGKSMIKYNNSNGSSAGTTSTGSSVSTSSCASTSSSVSNGSSASTGYTFSRGFLK